MVLQAPGQGHFGPLLCRGLAGVRQLGGRFIAKAVHVHIWSSRLYTALEARDVDVLVQGLYELFRLRRSPLGIRRKRRRSKRLQDLRDCHEHLMHTDCLPVHAAHQAPAARASRARRGFEEDEGQLPPQRLPLVAPALPASQGFVLCDVQDR